MSVAIDHDTTVVPSYPQLSAESISADLETVAQQGDVQTLTRCIATGCLTVSAAEQLLVVACQCNQPDILALTLQWVEQQRQRNAQDPRVIARLKLHSDVASDKYDVIRREVWEDAYQSACKRGFLHLVQMLRQYCQGHEDCGIPTAAKYHRVELLDYLLQASTSNQKYSLALHGAYEGGHVDLVESLTARWLEASEDREQTAALLAETQQSCFSGACKGGHRELVDQLIKCGVDDWQMGLGGAAAGGHLDLVDFLFKQGSSLPHDEQFDLNCALEMAALKGQVAAVEKLLALGADQPNRAFLAACERGHVGVIEYLFKAVLSDKPLAASDSLDLNEGFLQACEGGHRAVVDLILAKVEEINAEDADLGGIRISLRDGLLAATERKHKELACYLVGRLCLDESR